MTSPVQLIREWYATLASGDVRGALARLDPDIEWIEAESSPYGGPEPLRGPGAVLRSIWLPLQRDWEHLTIEPGELIELSSRVVALVRYRGLRRGTGAQLDAQAAHVWEIQGNRITRYRGFADTHALQVAAGSITDRNRGLAREESEVWSTGEIDRLDELVADDVIHHDPYDPYAAAGLEGLKASIRATRERFHDFEISVLDQVAEGDRVATRWRATMRRARASTDEPPTEVSMTGIMIERFADGKVVESWRSMDRLGLLHDLGVLPRSAADRRRGAVAGEDVKDGEHVTERRHVVGTDVVHPLPDRVQLGSQGGGPMCAVSRPVSRRREDLREGETRTGSPNSPNRAFSRRMPPRTASDGSGSLPGKKPSPRIDDGPFPMDAGCLERRQALGEEPLDARPDQGRIGRHSGGRPTALQGGCDHNDPTTPSFTQAARCDQHQALPDRLANILWYAVTGSV